jgi:uridylate kinase
MVRIISVGGSIIVPKTGFDVEFLKKFRQLILEEVKKGNKFVLIIGGGAVCRQYQGVLKEIVEMSNLDLDTVGIAATVYNANFVRLLFKDYAYEKVIQNPNSKIKADKPIIVAAGWKPGCSTDMDAVLHAKARGAVELLNLSNIDFVYDKDPNTHPDAKKLENISWAEIRRIVGNKWVAGANAPFDPIASKMAQKLNLKVSIIRGTNLEQVRKALNNEKFIGTVINN